MKILSSQTGLINILTSSLEYHKSANVPLPHRKYLVTNNWQWKNSASRMFLKQCVALTALTALTGLNEVLTRNVWSGVHFFDASAPLRLCEDGDSSGVFLRLHEICSFHELIFSWHPAEHTAEVWFMIYWIQRFEKRIMEKVMCCDVIIIQQHQWVSAQQDSAGPSAARTHRWPALWSRVATSCGGQRHRWRIDELRAEEHVTAVRLHFTSSGAEGAHSCRSRGSADHSGTRVTQCFLFWRTGSHFLHPGSVQWEG